MEKLTLPAELENLDLMMDLVLQSADTLGFDKKDKYQIRLASEEVLVNIINHAYPGKRGAVELTIYPKPKEGLEVVFADWGIPFNPMEMPEPKLCEPLTTRKIGGLGVYLLRKVMDEVSYKRENGRNILTIYKKAKSKK